MAFVGAFVLILGLLLIYAGWKNQAPSAIIRSALGG